MNGLLRHSTLFGSQLREDGTVVAPGFLQNPAVRNWLGGIVPAWTMLDQKSSEALRLPPLPPVGAIRFAADFSPEEIGQSAVARNALILLHSASVTGQLTTTGNLPRAVSLLRSTLHLAGSTRPFWLQSINEPDFLPLARHLVDSQLVPSTRAPHCRPDGRSLRIPRDKPCRHSCSMSPCGESILAIWAAACTANGRNATSAFCCGRCRWLPTAGNRASG